MRGRNDVRRAPLGLGFLPDDDFPVEAAGGKSGTELRRGPGNHPNRGGVADEGGDGLVVGGAEDADGLVAGAGGEVAAVVIELGVVDDVTVLGFNLLLLLLLFLIRRHFLFCV